MVDRQGAKSNVGVITLNRPKALNALSDALMREVSNAVEELESDKQIGALIITGSEKAFAAGIIFKKETFQKLIWHDSGSICR